MALKSWDNDISVQEIILHESGGNMLSTLNNVVYKAFGFNINSEIHLPELSKMMAKGEEIDTDIDIQLADLTDLWRNLSEPNRHFAVKENIVLFQIPKIATFCIQDGNKIMVCPMDGSHEDQIRLYVLGTCMGALLMQRKILPLHGSAIVINGEAYAIVGDSGAGKSTLASALINKGYQLISDDVIPVSLSAQNIPVLIPAYPQQKLWQESLDAFGMNSKNYRPIFDRESKFTVPVTSQFSSKPYPLAGVFELVKAETEEIKLKPLPSLQRLHTLFNHTYRNFLIDRLGLREWHFNLTAKMANNIQVYQLQRPVNRFTAHDLTSLILNTIKKGN